MSKRLESIMRYPSCFKWSLIIGWILVGLTFTQCKRSINQHSDVEHLITVKPHEKHRGAHVFRIRDTTNFEWIADLNIDWITLVPWGFQEDVDSPDIRHHNGDSIMIAESDKYWLGYIRQVREAGFKVFIKPHVWINKPKNNQWRADVFPKNEQEWEVWKNTYRDFILRYARIAEEAKAEMFCVGAELSKLTVGKPQYWVDLIKELKSIFSGQITYAANWHDEFDEIEFWEELDFIGIQAYFPLTKENTSDLELLKKGWDIYLPSLRAVHKKFNKPILFTEMGYKSTLNGASKPWEWVEKNSYQEDFFCLETQANSYQAFYEKVWDQPWFAGVHLWQIRMDVIPKFNKIDFDFTIRGKTAEQVIKDGFGMDN